MLAQIISIIHSIERKREPRTSITTDGSKDSPAEHISNRPSRGNIIRNGKQRPRAVSSRQTPCHQSHVEEWHQDNFNQKYPPEPRDRDQQERKGDDPEEGKAEQVRRCNLCTCWQRMQMPRSERWPDGLDHAPHSITSQRRDDAVENHAEDSTDGHGDVGADHAIGSSCDDRKADGKLDVYATHRQSSGPNMHQRALKRKINCLI